MPDGSGAAGIDRCLRAALEPSSGAPERIARRALAGGMPSGRRAHALRHGLVVAGLALAAVALAVSVLVPRLRPAGGEESAGAPGGRTARYSITNRGEVLVVQALDGGPSSLHASSGRGPSPPGMRIIVLGGD